MLKFKSTSSNSRVTSLNQRVTSSSPQVMSQNLWVKSSDPRVTISNPQVIRKIHELRKLKFIKEQEAKGLLSKLTEIKVPIYP